MMKTTRYQYVDNINGDNTPRWRTLHEQSGLRLDNDHCLPLRYRGSGCSLCVQVCPQQAIELQPETVVVNDHCVGCGRCTVACPMGALDIPAFQDPVPLPGSEPDAPRAVECWRVPDDQRAAGALTVPCLGGIDAAWLIEQQARHGALRLLDRGLCRDCPSGNADQHPAVVTLTTANALLDAVGIAPMDQPGLIAAPLAAHSRPKQQADADSEVRLSRRAFFTRALQRGGQGLMHIQAPETPPEQQRLAAPPRASRARWRLLGACLTLQQSREDTNHRAQSPTLPASLFAGLEISEQCCAHGVCAAVCPTGALRQRMTDTEELRLFQAVDCIECGACVRACPEQALQLNPGGAQNWRQRQILRRFTRRECTQCGSQFTAMSDSEYCDSCGRSHELVKDVFATLFSGSTQPD